MSLHDASSVAYWYPQPYWSEAECDAVKNFLPFFDEVAILLPSYMYGRHRDATPWLAGPLEDAGVLTVLEPGEFIDDSMALDLFAALDGLLASGAFDDLEPPSSQYGYQELSHSRLGWDADVAMSSELIDRLIAKQLALPTSDGVSVPLHPIVRTTILVILAQLAPLTGRKRGLDLTPITTDRRRVADMIRVLQLPGLDSLGQVVALDVEVVGIDLRTVPLDDVLGFRAVHGDEYRRYLRNVRTFVRGLSVLDAEERDAALLDRQEELGDHAADLRRISRTYWKQPLARVGLGAAGASVSLATGSVLPAGIAAAVAALEWEPADTPIGPFSYLLEVRDSLTP